MRGTGWVFCPSASLSPFLPVHYLYRIPPPKFCGLGTKGTKTWFINQHSRDYGYLPINHCGGATYNQTNGAGRRAVIQAMMSPSLSLWVLMLVVGLWFWMYVCVLRGCRNMWLWVCNYVRVCKGVSEYVVVGLQFCLCKCLW